MEMFAHKAGASGMIEEKNDSTKVLTMVSKGTCGSSGAVGSFSFPFSACGCSAAFSSSSAFSACTAGTTGGLFTFRFTARALLLLFSRF